MAYNEPTDYECLINAARTIATQRVPTETSDEGIDNETREAARSLLRTEFKRCEVGDDADDETHPGADLPELDPTPPLRRPMLP